MKSKTSEGATFRVTFVVEVDAPDCAKAVALATLAARGIEDSYDGTEIIEVKIQSSGGMW